MSNVVNAIVINGYVGKELTLEYLNKILINKGINVMYMKLNESGEIIDMLVNNQRVEYYTYKDDEIIFDEFDIVSGMYEKYKCDILITKSSKYNLYLNIILYGITKVDNCTLEKLTYNSFLTKSIPIVTATQTKEIMNEIHRICNKLKIIPFISEHFHYSFIKYNTGINMDYSYLSFVLSLHISEIFTNSIKNNGTLTCSYPRVKMYGLLFYKNILPIPLDVKIQIDNLYYGKIIEKYNSRFYCNVVKTASSSAEITEWFAKSSQNKNVKICIFHMSPSLELIDIINNLCSVKYNSVYIVDYKEIGYSYNNLVYMNKYNMVPKLDTEWTETIYDTFSKKIHRNITIDNTTSIMSWIFKYTGLHPKIQFDILCVGSKKMIDDIISNIN
jgi:hypothetical protein